MSVLRSPEGSCASAVVFQSAVQQELDALLEQQGSIESKMVALQRMG